MIRTSRWASLLILAFTTLTTPMTFLLLARAALYRDRRSGNPAVPPADGAPTEG